MEYTCRKWCVQVAKLYCTRSTRKNPVTEREAETLHRLFTPAKKCTACRKSFDFSCSLPGGSSLIRWESIWALPSELDARNGKRDAYDTSRQNLSKKTPSKMLAMLFCDHGVLAVCYSHNNSTCCCAEATIRTSIRSSSDGLDSACRLRSQPCPIASECLSQPH